MSQLTEKTTSELLTYNFLIPSYQRGYRWTKQQVEDLLNDVWHFATKPDKKENEWYCLQPIVVKAKGENYVVLDGQQRLTTIALILKYISKNGEKNAFEIEYETRETEHINSKAFLNNIDSKTEKDAESNIDYYHMFQAFQTIQAWFEDKKQKEVNSIDTTFVNSFFNNVKVIWYEINADKDEIEIFTRINVGKIPLTNAELIKALFLNSSNFKNSSFEEIRLRQLEIASEWDLIENKLQNQELWYLINKTKNELPTRIEYILNIIKDMEGVNYGNDAYATFRFFSEKFKTNTKDEMLRNWLDIKRTFQSIEEWFLDRELFHKVGYLIEVGLKVNFLLKKAKSSSKSSFKKWMNVKIAAIVNCENLEELEYVDGRIKNVLLLHNIQTLLLSKNETNRFSFHRYKTEKWDIEHIHANATEVKVAEEEQVEWLNNNFVITEQHKCEICNQKIAEIKKEHKPVSDEEFKRIIEYVLGEPDNSLRNLCLLDRKTNRSYKNDSFKNKRKKIITKEKAGTFVPICTRNVFLKYYSDEVKGVDLWNENDCQDYFNDLKECITNIKKEDHVQ